MTVVSIQPKKAVVAFVIFMYIETVLLFINARMHTVTQFTTLPKPGGGFECLYF